jgi:hypothetical protein
MCMLGVGVALTVLMDATGASARVAVLAICGVSSAVSAVNTPRVAEP